MGEERLHRTVVEGATLLTLEDPSFPMVRFIVALRQGAVVDEPNQSGSLRLMMEMLLRGTQRASRSSFNMELEVLGSAVEASAEHELAYLSGVCLERHLVQTLSLVGEALTAPAFLEEEFEALVQETVESLRAERDDDDSVADHFLRASLYFGHPLGRSPAGSVPDLERLSLSAVTESYKRIAASQLVIGMAGAVTAEVAEALWQPILRAVRRPAPAETPLPAPPEPNGLDIMVVDKPERSQVQLRLSRLSINGRHPDVDAFWLGITAFGGTFTSPFTREVRDERGWSYVAHADYRRRALCASPVVLRSAPALEDAINCLALEVDLYRGLAHGNLPATCVASAKDYLLNRTPFEVATAYDLLAPVVIQELLGLPHARLWQVPERLNSLDLATIPDIVAKHLHPQNVVALLVAPAESVVAGLEERFPQARVRVVDFREGLGLNLPP